MTILFQAMELEAMEHDPHFWDSDLEEVNIDISAENKQEKERTPEQMHSKPKQTKKYQKLFNGNFA